MLTNKKFIFIILSLVLIIISGRLGFKIGEKNIKNPDLKSEKHQEGYKYVSPLLECTGSNVLNYNHNNIKIKLEDLAKEKIREKQAQNISIYFRDLNNGPWLSINGEEKFSPASLLKVPLMIAYFKLAENNPSLLNKKIKVTEEYKNTITQNIPPAQILEVNKEYSVEDLIERMIKYSDNLAANVLLTNIDEEELEKIYHDLGVEIPKIGQEENFMSIIDYSTFFRILYNSSYLNTSMSEKALSIMANSDFTMGIKRKLPAGTVVSHKFGERVFNGQNQLHDCGIVYLGKKNYLICIMTRGNDFTLMEDTIADLSRLVFDHVLLQNE